MTGPADQLEPVKPEEDEKLQKRNRLLETAARLDNDQTLLIILIEDIVAVNNLDEILTVDHIDVFFVAPSDFAASMGHIGDTNHPEVQEALDTAIKKIVAAGKVAGTLAVDGNVEHYAKIGVKCFMTGVQPWIEAGAKNYMAKAAGK